MTVTDWHDTTDENAAAHAGGLDAEAGLLLLHGINDDQSPGAWAEVLTSALRELREVPAISETVLVVAPSYLDLLTSASARDVDEPESTSRPEEMERSRDRLNYFMRQAQLWHRVQAVGDVAAWPEDKRGPWPKPTDADAVALVAPILEQVKRYRSSPDVRHAILQRILPLLQPRARWVVVGHSLGSLVAMDLIMHLPAGVEVPVLVTVGSPVGRSVLTDHLRRTRDRFPHGRVGVWINAFNPGDPVPGGVGASLQFPEAVDIVVPGRIGDHSAATCLANPSLADAVGRALFGSPSREVSVATRSMETAWRKVDVISASSLQLAFRTQEFLNIRSEGSSTPERWRAARELLVAEIGRTEQVGALSSLPDLLSDLSVHLRGKVQAADASSLLTFLVSVNAISPFEIEVEGATTRDAVRATVSDLGLPPAHADVVWKAYSDAVDSYKSGLARVPKVLWPALAVVGVGMMVAAPYAVIAMAPAGLAGAAAITAGLAALGPGGMMGGLMVVGALAGAGSLSAAVGTMAPALAAQSPDQVKQTCVELMTRAAVDDKLQLVRYPGELEWRILSSVASHLNVELAQLRAVSDEDARAVKDAGRKLGYVVHAMAWLRTRGIGPSEIEAS
jgi:pimeloyl-ACP methyl ester carboxylesterase